MKEYRNIQTDEFLKELHLTEGRATGVPTITRELKKNGSPEAVFETDEERYYFKTSFSPYPLFYLAHYAENLYPKQINIFKY